MQPSKAANFQDKMRNDFCIFMIMLWREMGLPRPTKMQLLFGDTLQKSKARKLCLLGYRGFAKTLIAAAFLLWLLYKDPTTQEAIWCSNQDGASDTTKLMLKLIRDVSWLKHLEPESDMDQSGLKFDVKGRDLYRGSSVTARGILGGITGSRADRLLVDDPETSTNGDTAKKRLSIDRAMDEATYVIKDGGYITVLGTVHFDDSLYTRLLQKGYKIYLFPMAVPSLETQQLCWDYYLPPIQKMMETLPVGTPLDRFSKSEIELKRETGLLSYERQCLVNPFRTALSQKPFDLTKIIIFPCDRDKIPLRFYHTPGHPESLDEEAMSFSSASLVDKLYKPYKWDTEQMRPYDRKIMIVDPAGGKKNSDEVAFCVVGSGSGYAVLFHSEGLHGGSSTENLSKIIEVARRHKVDEISVESTGNLGMFASLLRAEYFRKFSRFGGKESREEFIPISDYNSGGVSKERKITASIDPVINSGRLIITPEALISDYDSATLHSGDDKAQYRLTYQLSYFSEGLPRLEKDDRIDVLAVALMKLKSFLTITPEDTAETYEDWLIKTVFAQDEKQFEYTRAERPASGLKSRRAFLSRRSENPETMIQSASPGRPKKGFL